MLTAAVALVDRLPEQRLDNNFPWYAGSTMTYNEKIVNAVFDAELVDEPPAPVYYQPQLGRFTTWWLRSPRVPAAPLLSGIRREHVVVIAGEDVAV